MSRVLSGCRAALCAVLAIVLSNCGGGSGGTQGNASSIPAVVTSDAPTVGASTGPKVIVSSAMPSTRASPLNPSIPYSTPLVDGVPPTSSGGVAITATPDSAANAGTPLQTSLVTVSLNPSDVSRSADNRRTPQYISSANVYLNIYITPSGGTTTSSLNNACTSSSCTVTFSAPVGADTLLFRLTDGSGNVLSTFSTVQVINPRPLTTLNFTANPVVDHATIALSAASLLAGSAGTSIVTVNAYDKANQLIVGSANYVNANGTPVAFRLSTLTLGAIGQNADVALSGPIRIVSAVHAPIIATYGGGWLTSATISGTTSVPIGGTVTSGTLTITPNTTEYAIAAMTGNFYYDSFVADSAGNLWAGEDNHKIIRISPNLQGTEYSSGLPGNAGVHGIVQGLDGNMWFCDNANGAVGKLDVTTGVSVEYTSGLNAGANPLNITAGPDGQIWFGDGGTTPAFGSITTSGIIHEFAIPAGLRQVAFGPDGALYGNEGGSSNIVRMALGGAVQRFPTTGTTDGIGIVAGSDGNIWFTNYSNVVGVLATNGTVVNVFTVTGNPISVAVGPDQRMYVTEQNGQSIDAITAAGGITRYTSGITGSPYYLVQANNAMWFPEYGSNRIGKFVF